MSDQQTCPECGAALTVEQAERGTCPRCAMRLALLETADATEPTDPGAASVEMPPSIGPYRVLRLLGEGGMGVVYLAEQLEPIRRDVAVKVIKRGMDTRHVVARFEAERQALALMDHPAIAQVFEAGATEEGRPYFVMEYVDGEPITAYADRFRLALPQRLDLFAKVCAGVQHAHQKGVIHRDIKPSNVLVVAGDGTADPAPKIIDFGVAKATSKRLTERTLFTELGIFIGTPEYMSPEQAEVSVLDVDTRSDVYSLGVLLYELLTGVLPFDPDELRRVGYDEIRRRIREDEPAAPSSRVSTLGGGAATAARTRGVDLPSLSRMLRGDLDWIVLKCLAKEPERRYGSPAELAADLRRYGSHEPVVARPPSVAYKARKFVRRNRLWVVSAATVLVTLVAGIAGTTIFALREARQRRTADAALADLEQVVGFQETMLSDIDVKEMGQRLAERLADLAGADREEQRDRRRAREELQRAFRDVNTTDAARGVLDEEILGRAASAVGEQFADRPEVEARLRRSIGWTYYKLGMLDRAVEQLERAVEIHGETGGFTSPRSLIALRELGLVYGEQGRLDEAEEILTDALQRSREVLGETERDTAGTMSNLGLVYYRKNRFEDAARLQREALAVLRNAVGPDSPGALQVMTALADSLTALQQGAEAEALYRQALDGLRRTDRDDSADFWAATANLASCLKARGRLDEAERLYGEALAGMRRDLGSTHRHTVTLAMNLASFYADNGALERAETLYRELLDDLKEREQPETLATVTLRFNYALALGKQRRYVEAANEYAPALAGFRSMLGATHPQTVLALMLLDAAYWESGQVDKARGTAGEILAIAREDESRFRGANVKGFLARKLLFWAEDLQDPEWARRLASEAIELGGDGDPTNWYVLALACFETGDLRSAVEHQRRAVAGLSPDNPVRPRYEAQLEKYVEALDQGSSDG